MRKILRGIIKRLISKWFKLWYSSYTKNTHSAKIEGLEILVLPGVFNPTFLLSTKTLIRFLKTRTIYNKRFLELGCGTGTISVWAAKQGAIVTGSDINPKAIENTNRNAALNNVIVKTHVGSLLDQIDVSDFDIVVINPPYYPKKPATIDDQAWFCGENFEYFTSLFSQLKAQNFRSDVYMILSEDCAMEHIKKLAAEYSLASTLVFHSKRWIEHEFILKIEPIND